MRILKNDGMSLLEVLVASAISMVVILGIGQSIQFSLQSTKAVNNSIDGTGFSARLLQILYSSTGCLNALKGTGNPPVDPNGVNSPWPIYNPTSPWAVLFNVGSTPAKDLRITGISLDGTHPQKIAVTGDVNPDPNVDTRVYSIPLVVSFSPIDTATTTRAMGATNLQRVVPVGMVLERTRTFAVWDSFRITSCSAGGTDVYNSGWNWGYWGSDCSGPYTSWPFLDDTWGVDGKKATWQWNTDMACNQGQYMTRLQMMYAVTRTGNDCGKGCDIGGFFYFNPGIRFWCCRVRK